MLETLVISVFVCGSLSLLIILFTKFFLKTESYDDMVAKRKEQENELLGGKTTKKEKIKKDRTKVKKPKSSEDVGKPKAEVKPMVIEEEPVNLVEDVADEEMADGAETPRESVVSRRSKKKRRKNVSFSDDGEVSSNIVDQEMEAIKPSVVSKEQAAPIQDQFNSKRKEDVELKRGDSPIVDNSASKKKKRKARSSKGVEDEPTQTQQIQEPQYQQPIIQKVTQVQQSSPVMQKSTESTVEKAPTISDHNSAKKKKKSEKKHETVITNNAKPSVARDQNTVGEEAQNLIRVIQLTPMNRAELKTMCNALAEKGGSALTDPDEELQTQMRILRTSEAAMREDLLKERANSANLNKSATERIQSLNMKIAEQQAELGRTNQTLQEYRQFRDENERLKTSIKNQKDLENRFKIVTDQFAINAGQLDSTERAKKALEAMVERLQTQVKNLEKMAMDNSLSEQLGAAQNARAVSDTELLASRTELEKVKKSNATLCYENKALQDRAMKAEHEVIKMQQKSNAESRGAAEGQEDPNLQQKRNANGVARLEQMEKLVKEKESTITDLESQVQRLNQQIDSQRQKNNQLESRLSASSERLQSMQAEADKVARLSQSLRAKENEVADLQQAKETLDSRLTTLQSESVNRHQLNQQLNDRTAEVNSLRKENEELRRENELLKSSASNGDSEKFQKEIETLRTKNNELREKNWKTVEALNASQTDAERRIKEALEESRSEKKDFQQKVRQLESAATANEGWKEMLAKSEREKGDVEEQVNRYKAALSETETILRDLEQSVESEEKKWQAALNESEQEVERMRRELAYVYSELKKTGASHEEITDLDFAYRCVEKSLGDIVDEMEEKLVTAEEDLVEVTRQRDELAERLAAKPVEEEKTEEDGTALDPNSELVAEVERLRAELTAELKAKKELAQQSTKFGALVRIGQDALKEEQDLVKKLQLQLQAYEKKYSNGGKVQNAS